jgi:hypothetical protein
MHWAFFLLAPCDPGASAPEYVTVIVKRSTKPLDLLVRGNEIEDWLGD